MDYNYSEEMQQIAKEKQQTFLQPALGQADAMAQRMLKLPPPAAPGERGGKRDPLASANKERFRAQQKDAGT